MTSESIVLISAPDDLQIEDDSVDNISTSISEFGVGEKFYLTQRLITRPVSRISVIIQGSGGQSVSWELRKGSDFSLVGAVIHSAISTNTVNGDIITSVNSPEIAIDDYVWFEFAAAGGTLISFNATVSFQQPQV